MPVTMAIVGGAGGALGSAGQYMGNKEQMQAQERNLNRARADIAKGGRATEGWQDTIRQFMAGNPDMFGPQTTTTTTNEDTTPTITAQMSPLVGMLTNRYQSRLQHGSALPEGYEATQLEGINRAYEPAQSQERNEAARRGISASTFTLGSPTERARAGDIARAAVERPLLERQMENEDMAGAQGLAAQFGLGQHRAGTSRTTSPANIGAILSIYNMLRPQEPTVLM